MHARDIDAAKTFCPIEVLNVSIGDNNDFLEADVQTVTVTRHHRAAVR
jgi:hypothetical protein